MATEKIQRNTPQRKVILEELEKLSTHPTASELYAIVRRRLPRISLGTVYRNLELLVRNRTIKKIEIGGSETRFDAECMHHNHVRCVECGCLDDLMDIPAGSETEKLIHSNGYEIIGCRTEFIGICPDCRKTRSGKHSRVKQ